MKVDNCDIRWLKEVTYFECEMWKDTIIKIKVILNFFTFSICHWLVYVLCTGKTNSTLTKYKVKLEKIKILIF
jgi:hypothetical protein